MHFNPHNIAVFGASGALGQALIARVSKEYPKALLWAFSRDGQYPMDYTDEDALAKAAAYVTQDKPLDLVIVANGLLHDDDIAPEKSLRDLSADKFHRVFQVNTVIPALIAKHFLPKLNKTKPSILAALSARVGSVSDNRLGGWYAYRASKAALNMIIKNAAIEIARTNQQAIIVGLHPGTVDSPLSRPFQTHVPKGKLFTPDYSAQSLLKVLSSLTPDQTGKCFAWDGKEILP